MRRLAPVVFLLILFGAIGLIGVSNTESNMGSAGYDSHRRGGTEKKMSPEEVKRLLLMLKEMGLDDDQLPTDPVQLEQVASQIAVESVYWEGVPGGPATGLQQLVLTPSGDNSELQLEVLPSSLEGPEWTSIFEDELGCSYVDAQGSIEERRAKQEEHYRRSLPDYPMLARIWDTYVDVKYMAHEVAQLRAECAALFKKTNHSLARSGLKKLMDASDKALHKGAGLSLLAD